MFRLVLSKKFIIRLLLPLYLLVGIGIGNGLLWCQESDAYSHMEYNPTGKCEAAEHDCLATDDNGFNTNQLTPSLSRNATADCLDTLAALSHATARDTDNLLDDLTATEGATLHPSFGNFSPVIRLTNLKLAAQPPPRQALIALRTIVLLN